MELDKSEVLLLSQLLFLLKSSDSVQLKDAVLKQKVHVLYEKLSCHLAPELSDAGVEISLFESCEDEQSLDCGLADSEQFISDFCINSTELLTLPPIQVTHDEHLKTLKFDNGISKGRVDADLDEGQEIFCDVEVICRRGDEMHLNTAAGWVIFKIEELPTQWSKLLPLNKKGAVNSK